MSIEGIRIFMGLVAGESGFREVGEESGADLDLPLVVVVVVVVGWVGSVRELKS